MTEDLSREDLLTNSGHYARIRRNGKGLFWKAQEPNKILHSHAHAQGPNLDTLAMAAALLARWKTRPDMVLAFDACRLVQMRAFRRRHGGRYWRAEHGPKSPAFD